MNIIDAISTLSIPLTIKSYNDQTLGTATGFFWRSINGKTYLISNYHVFSGNHYLTHKSIRNDSAFPAKIEYPRFVSSAHLNERALHTIELCDEAGNDPTWRSHPIHDEYPADIGVVEVPSIADDRSFVYAVNDDPLRECDKPLPRYHPGFELMIAGFFLKDRPTGYFPTYIRGSVASEMDALYNGKMAFLIDALTSSGMSGSPVFAIGMEQHDPNNLWSPFKTIPRFVGIYSGRIIEYESDLKRELQVGIVWRRELIPDIIQSI
jgi:hypothetical protein